MQLIINKMVISFFTLHYTNKLTDDFIFYSCCLSSSIVEGTYGTYAHFIRAHTFKGVSRGFRTLYLEKMLPPRILFLLPFYFYVNLFKGGGTKPTGDLLKSVRPQLSYITVTLIFHTYMYLYYENRYRFFDFVIAIHHRHGHVAY